MSGLGNLKLTGILFEVSQGIARVTLNRPRVHNAFNEHIIAEITQVFNWIENEGVASDQVRVVVLTGAGRSFSAGADLSWMKKMVSYSQEENLQDSLKLYDMVKSIRSCAVPVISKVHGAAVGGGAGLVAASDISLATQGTSFGFTEVKLGLIPAVISPFVVERIGVAHASRYFLTGDRFDVEQAKRVGLIQEYYQDNDHLDAAVESVAQNIASNSPDAVRVTKELIQRISLMDPTADDTRQYTASLIAAARVSKQGQEGLSAFFDKRFPAWGKD